MSLFQNDMPDSCKYTSVLLIDDDIDDRMIFGEVLKELAPDIIYHEAINGEDALFKLNNNLVPDLIFLDLNMPRIDGKQFLAEIQQQDHLKHIPIVIYTTSSHESDKKETRELGASYFLTKPNSLHELTHILVDLLQQKLF
ncbi:Response regulator receiver domain-containing protein [Chitinophaga ginsengisegetis]|uniref:Response regulator receiver domain-containing protein n=1 Tax=Chitinophaga ginsengisegetis TaxID=393003 RepID=A0A1T5PCG4_9BACT|nr:response regulator [Chitinophaga ginsengisegetis]MDR6570205.1 CheY-like chemotaxis protein [Chitinophaga ginsengisegetis]MDR6649939.1 CheY-like chemotaxis protein [Chitinophaga ginsengisegetis]MDR6656420.1 CheY-like chemotaxis protein [Chitinophaga ginsengisegetis]SKD10421.1 Response regulator receiver domain-containing protein [Chitinophaga ginsengisegetis]